MTTNVDSGYEPWVRASVRRGEVVAAEAALELLDKLDKARTRVVKLEAEVTRLRADAVVLREELREASDTPGGRA